MEFIERLEFGEKTEYSALESSIHLGRYLMAKQYCQDKKVLDIACGEGYGSFAMTEKWGAKEVHGVDISSDAIKKAKENFGHDKIHFNTLNAEKDTDFFEEGYFDLIVSFETIEHLVNPVSYLENLKKWLKKDGIILISCPNDNWYYSEPEQSNPFHENKYSFLGFCELCEGVLGTARNFMFGMPVSGFANISYRDSLIDNNRQSSMETMLSYKQAETINLPSFHNIDQNNVSYFLGVWGPPEIGVQNTSTYYGTSMDEARVVSYSDYMHSKEKITTYQGEVHKLTSEINMLKLELEHMKENEIKILKDDLNSCRIENKKLSIAVKGTNRENEFLRTNLTAAQKWNHQNDSIQRVNELEAELQSLFNSKSWKITAPLRSFFNRMR
ncbi:methyltransferase type 11 [Paenibacillus sp. FSL R7-269]|uniref:methyltransferase domain-containing protein n=1 Tax=Paenibacillus sp. FSL R7-269 TaxID=1226755 RepID=UPI0003E1EC42|nr:methyltransferase domain-containing protein [Paenibacillus sp. FSL R7-269]ETT50045.1 methyltransferase type 11 [Paenibacillus sp. FSL R7-269]